MAPRHSQLITESPQDQALMTQIIEAATDEDEVSRFVTKFKMGQTAVSAEQATAIEAAKLDAVVLSADAEALQAERNAAEDKTIAMAELKQWDQAQQTTEAA